MRWTGLPVLLASRCTATTTEKKRSPLRAGRPASVVELASGGCICRARINIAQHAARIEGKTSAARRVFRYSGRTTAGLALHRVSAGQPTKLDGVRALLAIREQTSLSFATTSATSTEYERRKQRRRRRQNLDPEESNEIERSCSSLRFNVFKLVDGSREERRMTHVALGRVKIVQAAFHRILRKEVYCSNQLPAVFAYQEKGITRYGRVSRDTVSNSD